MNDATNTPPLPADYHRRQAARIRRLAEDATTPAIKEQLRETARHYERLAELADNQASASQDA